MSEVSAEKPTEDVKQRGWVYQTSSRAGDSPLQSDEEILGKLNARRSDQADTAGNGESFRVTVKGKRGGSIKKT